ncbi:UNVERIFIED_CONTAM: GNAT family N-acetyltransferase [Halobacillus marinus]|uniref:GNAT family N-acetyltransferase n=1 Tax=Halobacillus sp. BAB-2008 TaxID=1246484 RepID=UPI0002A51303|nr:GNAT family N-acetyltransferase [Halobacillus sp. BAB-2008]ELK44709.1 GNAT family acetyltransferase [Halobacillus sp. BAB-2008]
MNPVMVDVKEKLETDRLILRIPEPGDGAEINASIRRSIEELRPWLGFVQQLPTVEETEANARESRAKFYLRTNLRYLLFEKESGSYVGTCGFHRINWNVPAVEIGYWLDKQATGKGYMREAVSVLTDYAFRGLHCARVEIRCESGNRRSRAVPEGLGFDLEGILRNEDKSVDGSKLTDTCVYAKVKTDV